MQSIKISVIFCLGLLMSNNLDAMMQQDAKEVSEIFNQIITLTKDMHEATKKVCDNARTQVSKLSPETQQTMWDFISKFRDSVEKSISQLTEQRMKCIKLLPEKLREKALNILGLTTKNFIVQRYNTIEDELQNTENLFGDQYTALLNLKEEAFSKI